MDHWFLQRFAKFPHRNAIVDGDHAMTYGVLGERIAAWAGVLDTRGLPVGSVVGLQGPA